MSAEINPTPRVTAILACSKCGAKLPEDAQFCLKCGKPVSVPPKDPPVVEVIPPAAPRPKRKRRILFWLLLTLFVVLIVWVALSDNPFAQGIQELVGWKHDQSILQTPFTVSAHNIRYYKFTLPEGSMHVSIVGQFTSSAESHDNRKSATRATDKDKTTSDDNDIEVYVLSEPAFTVWQNGYATSSVYESGKVSQGTLQAELPAGAGVYYLVFSNKSSPKTAKNVNASVLLRYRSWVPNWFRRMKESFSNWLGL